MRKIMRLLIVGLLICSMLTACGYQGNQNDATTQATETYTDFSAADCNVSGHNWNDATCQTPKTCTECGITEGSVSAHNYSQFGEAEQDFFGKWIRVRSCIVCGYEQTEEANDKSHGSAGYVEGTTLIVSVFADDLNTSWDFATEKDIATRDRMLSEMKTASAWLTKQIAAYGVESDFVYDWEENPDLYYICDFGQLLLVREDTGGYWKQEEYVLENVPSETLKKKYQAQDIIYMFYFNTDESNTITSRTISDRHNAETEIINIFVRNDRSDGLYYIAAPTFAHEIMHCFGAYDLYYASETIPQAYVDYCKEMISSDIMFRTSRLLSIDYLEFSRLDAYYMGLVDSCDEVTAWGLGKSTFSE